jgi:APA family basic amino acid/polyamine antiporter
MPARGTLRTLNEERRKNEFADCDQICYLFSNSPIGKGIIMSESAAPATANAGFHQRLGLFDATMLVAGSMIGSGIFIVSADISRDVGSSGWLLLVWVLTGVLTIIGALSYAELAGMMPHAGGQYVYLREAYGPLSAFLYGWTFFLVIQTGFIAAVSIAFAKFLAVLVPELDQWHWENEAIGFEALTIPVPWMDEPMVFFKAKMLGITAGQFIAVAVAVVLTIVNSFGLEQGRWVQNILTVAKTLGLALLIIIGLTLAADAEAWRQNMDNVWGEITHTASFHEVAKFAPWTPLAIGLLFCGAMVGALFSSDAWNNVTFIAAEVKNPQRTLPWGLVLGTTLVIALYVLANIAYLSALPLKGHAVADSHGKNAAFERGIDHAEKDRVGTAVLERVSPDGVKAMAIIIMISTFGCVNGLTIMGARLYYAMARDGLFFQMSGKLNRFGVPAWGLWLQCAWSIVLIFSGSYNELLDYIIFAALMFYILTVAGVFVLRVKKPDAPRPYRAWGYPVVPALYIILCSVIMLSLLVVKPVFSWPSFIIVLTGIPVYFVWRAVNKSNSPLAA